MERKSPCIVIRILLICFITALSTAPGLALAESGDRIILGTATKGGGFQLFGQNLADAVNAAQTKLHINDIATKGSKQNLPFLESGKIDVGLVEGNAARQALDGIGRPRADLKVLWVMYPNPGMFVVRGDSQYQTIEDLKGQPIAFGTQASGLRILVNDVLDGLGLQPDVDFQQIILSNAAEGPQLVINGQAEALWGAGIGWPGFVEVANSETGARFIAPDNEQIKRILKKHPHLQRMSVPKGTYKGQDKQVDSIGLWSLILVRSDMPEQRAYELAKALHLSEQGLSARLAQGRYTTAINTAENVPLSYLHPGVAHYLKKNKLLEQHKDSS